MNPTRLALVLISVIAAPAFADEWNDAPCDEPNINFGLSVQPQWGAAQVDMRMGRRGGGRHWGRRWHHQQQQQGRWEQRPVQQWVPGSPVTVWVPGHCGPWGRCSPGQYVTRMSEGHYVTTQQWVWVPFR
jgi:hypothetical protein